MEFMNEIWPVRYPDNGVDVIQEGLKKEETVLLRHWKQQWKLLSQM